MYGANDKVRAIELAFCELLQKKSLKSITVTQICVEANVSRASFYIYFDGISAMLKDIEDRTFEAVQQILHKWDYLSHKALVAGEVPPVFLEICRYCHENMSVFRALFGPYGDESFVCRYEGVIYEHFFSLVSRKGEFKFPELTAAACSGGVIDLCRSWFVHPELATPEEVALLHTAIVFRMIYASDRFSEKFSLQQGMFAAHHGEKNKDGVIGLEGNKWKGRKRGNVFELEVNQ